MCFKGTSLIKSSLLITAALLSYPSFSGTMGQVPTSTPLNAHPWSVTASIGWQEYRNMYQNDGQTPVGRLAIGREFTKYYNMGLGLELGVQNGGNMRLNLTQTQLDLLGGLPVQLTMKPVLDLLLTLRTPIFSSSPAFIEMKGGMAYRQMINERNTINDIERIAGEFQVGVGYPISEITNIALSYQGIYGGSPNYAINTVNKTAHINNIPTQQGVLLGISVVL